MTGSRESSEAGSRFLGAPLDPFESYLSTPWYQKGDSRFKENECEPANDEIWHGTECQGNFYEHNYNDSDSDTDDSFPDIFSRKRGADRSLVRESKVHDRPESVWKYGTDQELNVQRFPAILRTNRQIYSEASSLLYAELSLVLQPGDVLCMNTGKDIVKASERIWRHNPLHGIGSTNSSGQTVYAKPELDGVMEPHVLARFKKIIFEIELSWELEALQTLRDQTVPSLFVNEDLTVNPDDEAKLLAFYRRSSFIHQLVKILSNSSDIVRLYMPFSIEVLALYDMSLYPDSEDDDEGEEDSEDDDEGEDTERRPEAANERAMELFLESGLLTPLEKLSNVRSFEFEFTALDFDCEIYKPTFKHEMLLNDLKQKVERNYTMRDN